MNSSSDEKALGVVGIHSLRDRQRGVVETDLITVKESEWERLHAELARTNQAIEDIRALHVPWYEINGKRYDLRVFVSEAPEGHVCLKPGDSPYNDVCDAENDEHYVLGCAECRAATDEGEPGHRPWPCGTVRILSGLSEHQEGNSNG